MHQIRERAIFSASALASVWKIRMYFLDISFFLFCFLFCRFYTLILCLTVCDVHAHAERMLLWNPCLFVMRGEYGSTKQVCQRRACSAVCWSACLTLVVSGALCAELIDLQINLSCIALKDFWVDVGIFV